MVRCETPGGKTKITAERAETPYGPLLNAPDGQKSLASRQGLLQSTGPGSAGGCGSKGNLGMSSAFSAKACVEERGAAGDCGNWIADLVPLGVVRLILEGLEDGRSWAS